MEEFWASIILAIIQGITEWLPVSSHGHLVFFSELLGFPNTLQFDVAIHFGTLMAVFVYFGRDICNIVEAVFKGNWKSENAILGWMIIIGSIPAAILGLAFRKYFELSLQSLWTLGIEFAITAVILLIASLDVNRLHQLITTKSKNQRFSGFKGIKEMPNWKNALFIGLAQALAIFPGISRSGSTVAAGLISKLKMKSALRYSFLLAIPAVFGAGIFELGGSALPSSYLLPTFVAFVVGLLTIHLIFKYLLTTAKSLRWFALYAIILAIIVLIYAFFN